MIKEVVGIEKGQISNYIQNKGVTQQRALPF